MPAFTPRYKVWLEVNGQPVLGHGLEQLLRLAAGEGSLKAAAAAMQMSYRQAWGMVRDAERRLGFPLLERRVGGRAGGGATLTHAGAQLLAAFQAWQADLQADANRRFAAHFGRLGPGGP